MNLIYWIGSFLIGIGFAYIVYRKDKREQLPVKWLPALLRGITGFIAALLVLAPIFTG